MKTQRLRKKLEKSNDKLSIFANKKLLRKYNVRDSELCDMIKDFLTDEQIAKLVKDEHFRKLMPDLISDIIKIIKDDKIKLNLLEDDELLLDMRKYLILEIAETLQDNGKIKLLHNKKFMEKHEIDFYCIRKIILSLSESKKIELLLEKDFLKNQLKLDEDCHIYEFVASLKDDNEKLNMINIYDFEIVTIVCDILPTFSDINFLVNFLHNKFLLEKGIKPYQIIKKLDSVKQLEFISKFEELELSVRRKKTNTSSFKTRNKR